MRVNYLVTAQKDSGGPLIVEDDKNNRHVQGNLLRGTVNWLGVALSVVQRTKNFGQKVLVTIVLYFNLIQNTVFTNNVGLIP